MKGIIPHIRCFLRSGSYVLAHTGVLRSKMGGLSCEIFCFSIQVFTVHELYDTKITK